MNLFQGLNNEKLNQVQHDEKFILRQAQNRNLVELKTRIISRIIATEKTPHVTLNLFKSHNNDLLKQVQNKEKLILRQAISLAFVRQKHTTENPIDICLMSIVGVGRLR